MEKSPTERWAPVPGYESHYEVSDLGRVRGLRSGSGARPEPMLRACSDDGRAYRRVWLSKDGKARQHRVHKIVALAFLGAPLPGQIVRHKNGDRADNRAVNLTYGTYSQNTLDAVGHGTHNMASKTHCKRGHEFSVANTSVIGLATGSMARRCKACQRDAARRVREDRRVRS